MRVAGSVLARAAVAAAFLAAAGLQAADAPSRAAAVERIDARLKAQAGNVEEMNALFARVRAGKAAQEKLDEWKPVSFDDLSADALAVIDADPADDAALKAIKVVLLTKRIPVDMATGEFQRSSPAAALHARMYALIMKHHLERPDVTDVLLGVIHLQPDGRYDSGARLKAWKRVYEESRNPEIRGTAAVWFLEDAAPMLTSLETSKQSQQAIRRDIEELALSVQRDYAAFAPLGALADTGPGYLTKDGPVTLGKFADLHLSLLKHSVGAAFPGMKVPRIDGSSDEIANYRGKVVLLDFWATWCGPCKDAHPDLKALKQSFAGRPFEVIGVSVDNKIGDVTKYLKAGHELPWVNWHIGRSPLLEEWGVRSFPTYLLIDEQGIVRARTGNLTGIKELSGRLLDELRPAVAGG